MKYYPATIRRFFFGDNHPIFRAIKNKDLSKVKEFFSVENMSEAELGEKKKNGTYDGKDRKLWDPDVKIISTSLTNKHRIITPAIFAAVVGATDILQYLLEKGASFGNYERSQSVLNYAFEYLQVETLERLLNNQENIDLIPNAYTLYSVSTSEVHRPLSRFSSTYGDRRGDRRVDRQEVSKKIDQMQEMLKSKFFENSQVVPFFEMALDLLSIDEETGESKDKEKGMYTLEGLPNSYIIEVAYGLLESDKFSTEAEAEADVNEKLGINILEKVCSLPRSGGPHLY